jgi:hypothetical protein
LSFSGLATIAPYAAYSYIETSHRQDIQAAQIYSQKMMVTGREDTDT